MAFESDAKRHAEEKEFAARLSQYPLIAQLMSSKVVASYAHLHSHNETFLHAFENALASDNTSSASSFDFGIETWRSDVGKEGTLMSVLLPVAFSCNEVQREETKRAS